jgi:hypothetical protein
MQRGNIVTQNEAKSLVNSIFTNDVRKAFKLAINNGFEKYVRIINGKNYQSLNGYEKNGERRVLYSAVCSCLDGEIIRSVGFDTFMEQFTSSVKTNISNELTLIDVFDIYHNNDAKYQQERFELNRTSDNKKYILLVYYCDKSKGILQRIMIRVPDCNKNIIYEEDLIQ